MKRIKNLGVRGHLGRSLALALISLLAGCGRFRSRDSEGRSNLHSITISWASSPSPVIGYIVYRVSPAGGPPVKLTARPIAANQFTDTDVEVEHTYSYYVTSVDSKGVEGRPSVVVSATVPTPETFVETQRNRFSSFPFIEWLRKHLRSLRHRIHRPHFD